MGWIVVLVAVPAGDVAGKSHPALSMTTRGHRHSLVVGDQHRGGSKVYELSLSEDTGAVSCWHLWRLK